MNTNKENVEIPEPENLSQETTDNKKEEELSQFSNYGKSDFSRDFKTPNWINNNSKFVQNT